MSVFEIIDGIVEIACSWRFYLCLGVGILLIIATINLVLYEPVAWVVSACIFIAAFVVGWRWDSPSK